MSGTYAHRPVECSTCRAHVKRKGFREHMRLAHPSVDISGDLAQLFVELPGAPERGRGGRPSKPKPVETKAAYLPVTCAICRTQISRRNNLRTHVQSQHREHAHRPLAELIAQPTPPALDVFEPATRSTSVVETATAPMHREPRVTRSSSVELPPLTSTEVVQAIVDQFTPDGIMPTQALGAALVCYDAVSELLRALSERAT